jgi:hypothetical protein
MATVIEKAAHKAEEALGGNLVALTDILDLHVRQKDERTLRILKELTEAWTALCAAGAHTVEL